MRIKRIEEKMNDPPVQKLTSYDEARKQLIKVNKILRQLENDADEV